MELHKNTLTFTTFMILALTVLGDPNNPRTPPELIGPVEWPCHMARALLSLGETQDGPRPLRGWVMALRTQMWDLGARPRDTAESFFADLHVG